MLVKIKWSAVLDEGDARWRNSCGLYAYVTPNWRELLYIGKVYGCTVRQRWSAPDKMILWRALERQRQIFKHLVIFGEIWLASPKHIAPRLSREKILDIESLLIKEVQPWGNVACKQSRISRPGMLITCTGDWPLRRKTFRDFA